MKIINILKLSLAALCFASTHAFALADWATPAKQQGPAIEIGIQSDGKRHYVCRVSTAPNVVITGKLDFNLKTCFYAFFGKEYSSQAYELLNLVGVNGKYDFEGLTWRPWNGGADWDVGRGGKRRALIGGTFDNKPIVPCRAILKGSMVGGHFHGNTCFLPLYGLENPVNNFELLGY